MKKYTSMIMVALIFTLAISVGGVTEANDEDVAVSGIYERVCGVAGGGWDVDFGSPPPTNGVHL